MVHPAPQTDGIAPHDELRQHWHDFADADAFPGSDTFADRMEAAGLCQLVPVSKEALEEAFAYERGIEPGGMMWELTEAGRAALDAPLTSTGERG